MEMLIYRLGILMLGFSFGLFALFFQVPVSAQQQFPPPSSPPPTPPPVASPPPPLLSPPPPSPLIQSPPPPLVPPTSWTLSPPPTLVWTAPHPPPTIQRNHRPSKRKFKWLPPPKQHKLNSGEKVGLIFIVIAGVLQFFVAGSLILLRRQLLKVKDRYENAE